MKILGFKMFSETAPGVLYNSSKLVGKGFIFFCQRVTTFSQ